MEQPSELRSLSESLKVLEHGDTQHYQNTLIRIISIKGKLEEELKIKENAYNRLAASYCSTGHPERIMELFIKEDFSQFNMTRAAKINRQMIDLVAQLENTTQLQIEMCEQLIVCFETVKKTYLKHKMVIRKSELLLDIGKFTEGLKLLDGIIGDVRKADDKHLLLDIYLLESKLNFRLANLAKAKASLTAARACSNSVYCPPVVQADIDMQAGILYSEEKDYRTGYSYFYESFEAFNSLEDSRALSVLKYMLLCKIMNNNQDDVKQLLTGKYGLKYAGRDLQAMKAINDSYAKKSLVEFTRILQDYHHEIEEDKIVRLHIKSLYDKLLEKNLFQVISAYSHVQIGYIAERMQLDIITIQQRLSELILDKKIDGTLDQGNDCLILFDDIKSDNLYKNALSVIQNMNGVTDRLFERAKQMNQFKQLQLLQYRQMSEDAYSDEDISSIEQNDDDEQFDPYLEDIQFHPRPKQAIKEEDNEDDSPSTSQQVISYGIKYTKPNTIRPKSTVLTDKTNQSYVESKKCTFKPQYTQSYQSYLQTSRKFNYSSKSFNTLAKKSDPVARYQQMNQQWNKNKFLKSTNGNKEGRKLKLDERIEGQKQILRDEGLFHRYVTKSQLFL